MKGGQIDPPHEKLPSKSLHLSGLTGIFKVSVTKQMTNQSPFWYKKVPKP